jgi:citrate synthase
MAFNIGLEGVVAAETVLSEVDGEAGCLVLRGHRLQDIAGRRSVEWLIAEVCRRATSRRRRCGAIWRRCAPWCSDLHIRC